MEFFRFSKESITVQKFGTTDVGTILPLSWIW